MLILNLAHLIPPGFLGRSARSILQLVAKVKFVQFHFVMHANCYTITYVGFCLQITTQISKFFGKSMDIILFFNLINPLSVNITSATFAYRD